ncbi:MAG TPA: TonB-dependent receptor plug domain-containing protein, partial [Sphingomonadales bacterium]|nr:TonB-dependent receptor plug domain-containing protein [Sphingomonadales bacterium]
MSGGSMKTLARFGMAVAMLVFWVGAVFAYENGDTAEETITVIGSYIPRQIGNASSPLAVVDADELAAIGAGTIADMTQFLTINTGAQNNSDAFTQNISTGTSNINLRGLGVSSTLVLLNGRRQVVSGANTDLGLLFIDTSSLVPMIAIERVEILKDGAAA